MVAHTINRTTMATSRIMEFFTEKELQLQIGDDIDAWPILLVKELIDNSLDACESGGVTPLITVDVENDSVMVGDNGPGLPKATLVRSLDYLVRVSDKNHYIAPTRGQLGNALKCVWSAPFVADGECGQVDVITGSQVHHINVTLDRIAQEPRIEHTVSSNGAVKNGTFVKIHWSQVAGLLFDPTAQNFYHRARGPLHRVGNLLDAYAALNPHATFRLKAEGRELLIEAPDTAWKKWRPDLPTSPHWYKADDLAELVAAYVSHEREGGEARTVRDFIGEFNGLKGTVVRKRVIEAADLSGAYLTDLVTGNDVDRDAVGVLHEAMMDESRLVTHARLGAVGKKHLTQWLAGNHCDPETIRYKAVKGVNDDGLPHIVEVAFGIFDEHHEEQRGVQIVGLNWSPSLGQPIRELQGMLSDSFVSLSGYNPDPAMLVVHIICPRLKYTDRSKSRISIGGEQ